MDKAASAVVIDDDPDVRALLLDVLDSAGFIALGAADGREGIEAVRSTQPTIVTVDVDMPGIDGFETARRVREISDAYIVMITAASDEASAVLGFGVGADDVVIKPFRARELRARLIALTRRPRTGSTPVIAPPSSGLHLDRSTHEVTVDGRAVALTPTEFTLLDALVSSGRNVRSKADLVLALRDETYLPAEAVEAADERAVEAHITNLRRKLGESAAQPRFIETVRGIGYRTVFGG